MIERLGITEEVVRMISSKVAPLAESLGLYTESVLSIMQGENPALLEFLETTSQNQSNGNEITIYNPFVFCCGAAFAYDMLRLSIPEAERKGKTTKDLLDLTLQNINDHLIAEEAIEEDYHGESIKVDLSWFFDQLKSDSPHFMNWLEFTTKRLDGHKRKSDFLFGVTFVAMPFFMIKKTQELERLVFGNSSGSKAQ